MKFHFEAKIIVTAPSASSADDVLYEELQKRGLSLSRPWYGTTVLNPQIIIDLTTTHETL